MTSELRDGEELEDEYCMTGVRTQKAYLLLEGELEALVAMPWFWMRRRIVDRVRASTRFEDDCDSGRLPEGEDSRSEAECEASQSGLPQEGIAQPFQQVPKDPS